MKILLLTGMYPTSSDPSFGCFVEEQARSLRENRQGLEIDLLFFDGRASRLNYLRAALATASRLRAGGHDLVHAHYGLAGLAGCLQQSTPLVLTLHGSDIAVPWQRRLSRIAASRARAVIAVSDWMPAKLAGVAGRSAHVIPCGVDMERFHPWSRAIARRRLGWALDERRILFPGDPARAVKQYPLFRATVERLQASGLPVREAILAGVPREQVPDWMNASDLMLLTSAWEGSPMVLKEAMACDLPVVSLDVGDARALLAGALHCAVVGAEDPLALAPVAARILEAGERSDGRQRVRHLSLDAVAERVLSVYDSILNHAITAQAAARSAR